MDNAHAVWRGLAFSLVGMPVPRFGLVGSTPLFCEVLCECTKPTKNETSTVFIPNPIRNLYYVL